MDHMKLLCDFGEINWVFTDTLSIETFLKKIVTMVAEHMNADVCSIYLYNDETLKLTLKATKGLNPEAINRVNLSLGEGLSGLALKEHRAICERIGSKNPHFKSIPGIFEERYESFLAVPILRGLTKIGVLTVQREHTKYFKDDDIMAMKAIASQLANILENANLLMGFGRELKQTGEAESLEDLKFLKGKSASKGFAYAAATILDHGRSFSSLERSTFHKKYTIEDLNRAILLTREQLTTLQERVEERLSDAASLIFTSHLLMLKDRVFLGTIEKKIREGINPPEAVMAVARTYVDTFSRSSNPFIREKVLDVEDLVVRLVANITSDTEAVGTYKDRIIVARELFPSDLLMLASEGVRGIILASGGVTSHLSFLARSLGIPMVIITEPRLLTMPGNIPVLMDAELGNIYVNPSEEVADSFRKRNEAREKVEKQSLSMTSETFTSDGEKITLLANINLLTDLKLARELRCEGIGLYRTEFPFIIRSDFPCEEEQYVVYRKLMEGMPGKPVTVRTLDIGGDKVLSYFPGARESNPFLGMRSIRFTLHHKHVFIPQIRALLCAGSGVDLRIMFPMIASLEEYMEARNLIWFCLNELKKEGREHNEKPRIGMMIEVPSVLSVIDDFASEADFFSIGTNDLIQYLLAVDRTNEKVAGLYVSHHPSVLRAISDIVDAARGTGIEVSICGDMAKEAMYLPFLIGVGVRILSIDPVYLPSVQRAISRISLKESRKVAQNVLKQSRMETVAALLTLNAEGTASHPS